MTWIPDLGAFQPVLGRKFHVESEFEVKNSRFKRPEGKNKEKLPQKKNKNNIKITSICGRAHSPIRALHSLIIAY